MILILQKLWLGSLPWHTVVIHFRSSHTTSIHSNTIVKMSESLRSKPIALAHIETLLILLSMNPRMLLLLSWSSRNCIVSLEPIFATNWPYCVVWHHNLITWVMQFNRRSRSISPLEIDIEILLLNILVHSALSTVLINIISTTVAKLPSIFRSMIHSQQLSGTPRI